MTKHAICELVSQPAKEINPHEVKINRLQRKVERFKNLLGRAKTLNNHYKTVLQHATLLGSHVKQYSDAKAERERVRQLEVRVKEQEALIIFLQQSTIAKKVSKNSVK